MSNSCVFEIKHVSFPMKDEHSRGEKVARNKNSCNKNPTSAGWDYCSCLQLSVQFFLRNYEIAHKIALSKSPLTLIEGWCLTLSRHLLSFLIEPGLVCYLNNCLIWSVDKVLQRKVQGHSAVVLLTL